MYKEQPKPQFCQKCGKRVSDAEIHATIRGHYVAMCKECEEWIKKKAQELKPLMGRLFRR